MLTIISLSILNPMTHDPRDRTTDDLYRLDMVQIRIDRRPVRTRSDIISCQQTQSPFTFSMDSLGNVAESKLVSVLIHNLLSDSVRYRTKRNISLRFHLEDNSLIFLSFCHFVSLSFEWMQRDHSGNSNQQSLHSVHTSSDTIHPKEVTHKPRVQWVVRIKSYDQYQLQSGQSYAVLSFLDYPFDPLDYSTISGIISIRTGICAFLAYLGRRLLSVTTGISALNSVVSMLSTIVSSISAGTIALLAIVILAIDPSTPPMMSE